MACVRHSISSIAEAQTTEERGDRILTQKLRFINLGVTAPPAQLPIRNAGKEKNIRAHVMKNYLQQKAKASKTRNTLPAASKLSDHLIQFRLHSRRSRKGARRGTNEVKSDENVSTSTSNPIKMRAIMPKYHQNLREAVLARSLTDDMLCSIPPPINTSTPGTLALLEYYHTSFWDNSLACNPEGKWISVAISDPAMLHATLCLVALHKFQTRGEQEAKSYFWHRGEAIRLISESLTDPGHAASDATIGAVAVLSASDNSMHWPSITQTSHIEGMITLLNLRGGIDELDSNRHIKRVVAWADILHATAHNSPPQLEIARSSAHSEMKRLMDVVKPQWHSRKVEQDLVPEYFRTVFRDLQALTLAKSLLMTKTISDLQELRPLFSNLLFMTEHRVLELGRLATPTDIVTGVVTKIEAVKAAALIFSFHYLRDMAITAAFFDSLVRRLRDGLCGLFNQDFIFQSQNPAYIPDKAEAAPFLLWLCLNGWKASTVKARQTDREFFTGMAAMLCEGAELDSLEKLDAQMRRIVFLTEYYLLACSGLWADIKAWTTPQAF